MRKLFSIILVTVMLLVFATPTYAKVITKEKGTITISEDEVIDDDLYLFGESVVIEGTINGDVYIGAESVVYTGIISGDLIIGAGKVSVSGDIGDDLWIGAGNVLILGSTIGDGANIVAGSLTIDQESSIGGSLLVGSGTVVTSAPITRNFMAGAGTISLDALVGGELRVGASNVTLGSNTIVDGDFTYAVEEELTIADGATIAGSTRQIDTSAMSMDRKQLRKDADKYWSSIKNGLRAVSFFATLLVGLVTLWLFKKPAFAISKLIERNFISSIGWGLLVFVLAGPAFLLLVMTGVGIPLAFILLGFLLASFYMAKIWVSIALGSVVSKQFGWKKLSNSASFTLGLITFSVLIMLPVIGHLARLGVFLSGLGGLWLYLRSVKR